MSKRPKGTPYRLRQMAADLATAAASVRSRTGKLDHANAGTPADWGWSGPAASAYARTWQGWRMASELVADRMDSGARPVLNQLAAELEKAQRKYDDADATARALGLTVDNNGFVFPRPVAQPGTLAAGSPEAQVEQQVASAAGQGEQALEWARDSLNALFDQGWKEGLGKLNDMLGWPTTPATVFYTATTVRAGVSYIQSVRNLPALATRLFSEEVGPVALAYDRGEATAADLMEAAWLGLNRMEWARAFTVIADRAGFLRSGVPAGGALDFLSTKVLMPLAVVTDVITIINPGHGSETEQRLNQGAAWVNIAGTAAVGLGMAADAGYMGAVGGLLVADATLGWVPVAGQVLLVASGLVLAGIWAYDNVKPFHDFCNTVGSDVAHVAQDTWNAASQGVSDATQAVQNQVSNIQNTVGGAAKTLQNFFHWP